MMKKYIIGLGCSWTQGEGGYTEEIWKQYGGRVQIRHGPDDHLRTMEHENSWVNVLCRDHFPEYTPVNLGARGIGNRAAVHQLHFCDVVDFQQSTGIIVLLMSGMERFDFFQEMPKRASQSPDYYSKGEYAHYKWRTAWPIAGQGGAEEPIWSAYGKLLWSEQFQAAEQMMALLDLQTFCKAYNFKFVIANAFNQPNNMQTVQDYMKQHTGYLADKFDWKSFVHNQTPYISFVQKLIQLDGLLDESNWGAWHNFYKNRDWPSEYLTNCEGAHPTIKGYKVIASELAQFMKNNYYV